MPVPGHPTHLALGDRDAALAAWQDALDILEDLGHPNAAAVRARIDRVPAG